MKNREEAMRRTVLCVAAFLAAAGWEAAAEEAFKKHTVVPKDCLCELAKTYYHNPFRWKVIYSANQDKIKDPNKIFPGQVFTIPEVPGPEIGELGARPIETGARIEAPAPAPESPPEEAQAKAPEPAAAPAPPQPASAPPPTPVKQKESDIDALGNDLRDTMPKGLPGGYPSMLRVKQSKDWKEDGKITTFEGREATAAQGDTVYGTLGEGPLAFKGDRFTVYRPDVRQELDKEDATYLETVGVVEVRKYLGDRKYSLLILKSGDSVQPGDLLKKGGL